MSEARRRRSKELFLAALDKEPGDRSAFLAEACRGDGALLEEVLSLLESHRAAGGFLETPLAAPGALFGTPGGEEGKTPLDHPPRIGPYRIIEPLGEGGMGIVYLAEQTGAVRRKVALKVIKLGMDTREVVARFELERQALAVMTHPGIARVFDGGSTEKGQPFFVMEYVSGLPVTEYCDRCRLSTPARLRLFIRICEAIQHAHQKGIIHRDIKPSNVLVAGECQSPLPKVIDFGVARATDRRLARKMPFTTRGMVVGTPEYMSPEQAGVGAPDIDTRSDIYSLGVLLYEILVGCLPFDFGRAGSVSPSDIQRRIREENPPKPSRRLSTLGPEISRAASRRRTEPRALKKQLRGDLDWIVMKAMDKDRVRRYGSAAALADDIGRHLDGEPVLAGPPGASYRLKKFVSRNRSAVAAVLLVILALSAGLAVSTRFYVAARKARSLAQERLNAYQNLADLFLVEKLTEEAGAIWPPWPEKVPEMKAWLERAREVAARLPFHEANLEAMRRRALDTGEEAEGDKSGLDAARLRRLEEVLSVWRKDLERSGGEKGADGAGTREKGKGNAKDREGADPEAAETVVTRRDVERLEEKIAELRRKVSLRRSWTFADGEEQWLHDKLVRLVTELKAFMDPDPARGVMANVRKRIELARGIRKESIEDRSVEWARAVASIADPAKCPAYGGLTIRPQVGLVPLGRDSGSGLWEFAVAGTGEMPRRDRAGRIIPFADMAVVLVLLPGGTFRMGAVKPPEGARPGPNEDPYAYAREGPVQEVTLAPFFISKYEMTQEQWRRAEARIPGEPGQDRGLPGEGKEPREPLPAAFLSREDCAGVLPRVGLCLPTEAQWEYAARAGTTTVWYTGIDPASVAGSANLRDRSAKKGGLPPGAAYESWLDDGFPAAAPVGSFLPNPFGLHDVTGNVYEWCSDPFAFYKNPLRRGDGWRLALDPGEADGVVRGGSFNTFAVGARMSFRVNLSPDRRASEIGLRPARLLDE